MTCGSVALATFNVEEFYLDKILKEQKDMQKDQKLVNDENDNPANRPEIDLPGDRGSKKVDALADQLGKTKISRTEKSGIFKGRLF